MIIVIYLQSCFWKLRNKNDVHVKDDKRITPERLINTDMHIDGRMLLDGSRSILRRERFGAVFKGLMRDPAAISLQQSPCLTRKSLPDTASVIGFGI
jgi:hypothetical protein